MSNGERFTRACPLHGREAHEHRPRGRNPRAMTDLLACPGPPAHALTAWLVLDSSADRLVGFADLDGGDLLPGVAEVEDSGGESPAAE